MSGQPQMVVEPMRDAQRPRLLIVGAYLTGGRLYRCSECGAEVWSNFGHARRHDETHEPPEPATDQEGT